MRRGGPILAILLFAALGVASARAAAEEPSEKAGIAPEGGPSEVMEPPAAPTVQRPMKPCPECSGTGGSPCLTCEGAGKIEVPCPSCRGRGTGICSACSGSGLGRCGPCKGTGKKVVITVGRGGGVETVPCPYCRGRGKSVCDKCKAPPACAVCEGKKVVLENCAACGGRRSIDCYLCAGKGEIPDYDEEARLAVAAAEREVERKLQIELLRAERQALDASLSRWEDARRSWEGERVSERTETLGKTMARLSGLVDLTEEQGAELGSVQRAWKLCDDEFLDVEKSFLVARGKEVVARQKRREASSLLEQLETSRRVLDREIVSARQSFVGEYDAAVRSAGSRLGEFTTGLEVAERKARSFARKHARYLEELEERRKREEALETAFAGIPEAVARLANEHRIGEATVELQDSSTPESLRLEITILDPETFVEDVARVETVSPGDATLERLPSFLSEVYGARRNVTRVRLLVEAPGLDDTGHETRIPIQAFATERGRWSRLMTGEFRDDWRLVLSNSKPTPDFPRRGPRLPEGWPVIVLAMIAVLGLAIIYVARSKMLLR